MYIRFVTGASSISESIGTIKSPKVYIDYATQPVSLYLVVYNALSATICLFIDSKYVVMKSVVLPDNSNVNKFNL